jgi:hypothetical protein
MSHGLRWVIDLDIEKYFDSIPHSHLRAFLDRRVTDGVIRRMIDKWLKAGVLEDGLLRHATEGSPQGPKDLAEIVVAAGKQIELDPIRCSPHASPSASSPDRPPLHRRERSSPVKNRKREICTSGSARGRGGNIPTYSAQGHERLSNTLESQVIFWSA